MYKIWIYVFILYACIPSTFAQNQSKVDSLKAALKSEINSSQKVDTYLALAQYYAKKSTKRSKEYIDKAVQLAKSTNYSVGLIEAYSLQVTFLANTKQFEEAEKLAQEILSIAQKSQSKQDKTKAYLALGYVAFQQKNYQKSLEYYSQGEKLSQEIKTPKLLIKMYLMKGRLYVVMKNDAKRSEYYAKALDAAQSSNSLAEIVEIHSSYTYFFKARNKNVLALQYATKALEASKQLGDQNMIAEMMVLLASCYKAVGNYIKALDYFLKALKIRETYLNDERGLARSYNRIGVLLYEQQSYEKAIEYYRKNLEVNKKLKSIHLQALAYNNIALAYQNLEKYAEAKKNYQRSISLGQQSKYTAILGWAYNGMGIVHQAEKDYPKAKEWFDKAIKIRKRPRLLAQSYYGIGKNYQLQKQYQKAKEYYLKAAGLLQNQIDLSLKRDVQEGLSICYEVLGESTKALASHRLFKQLADSLLNLENAKGITRMEANYTFQKEKDSLNFAQERKQASLKSEIATRKANQRATYIGLGLVSVLLVISILFFLDKQKSNRKLSVSNAKLEQSYEEIKANNEEIRAANDQVMAMNDSLEGALGTVKHQKDDILSSITYALRIQKAMLPRAARLQKAFPEHFIFYRPRDIVSGDFYWFAELESRPIYANPKGFHSTGKVLEGFTNQRYILAAIDCTGHGVPGAFMSMIANNLLNYIVNKKQISDADQILNQLHLEIKQALHQTETKNEDGMEMTLVVIEPEKKLMQFAGARNPLWYVQNGEFKQIRGDRLPIGGERWSKERIFTRHEIDFNDPVTFYMFSDGYPDQFGGQQVKKFTKKKLQELLEDNAHLPAKQQEQILADTLDSWMEGHNEQIDDILVMGVKLT